MQLTRIIAPDELPVGLGDVRAQCRVDHDDEDALIAHMLDTAIERFDGYRGILGRCLINQTWRMDFSRLPHTINLPFPDVSSITGEFTDSEAGSVEFERLDCGVETSIRISNGIGRPGAITFTAGFGAAHNVPAPLKSAILMLAAHLYRSRDGGSTLPPEVDQMISPYRVWRI